MVRGGSALALAAAGQTLGVRVDLGFFGSFLGRFFFDQRLTVGHRDLIVVGMNFAEGQEPVTVPAVVYERRL